MIQSLGDAALVIDALAVLLAGFVASCAVVYLVLRCVGETAGSFDEEANRRADALLRDSLTAAEYQDLASLGYLEISSPGTPGRVYRVHAEPSPVMVYEGERLVMELCVGPGEPLPAGDRMLAHKLMIEGNEAEYLQAANVLRRWAA